jgi:hypothetical protein
LFTRDQLALRVRFLYKYPPPSRAVHLARKDLLGAKAAIRHNNSLVYKIGILPPEREATNDNCLGINLD